MNKEQSIDDFVKQLKEYMNDSGSKSEGLPDEEPNSTIEDNDLKHLLKTRYASDMPWNNNNLDTETNSSYDIDHAFLEEVASIDDEQEMIAESELFEDFGQNDECEEDAITEIEEKQKLDIANENIETVIFNHDENNFDLAFQEETEESDDVVEIDKKTENTEGINEDIEDITFTDTLTVTDSINDQSIELSEEDFDPDAFPEIKTIELSEVLIDYNEEYDETQGEDIEAKQEEIEYNEEKCDSAENVVNDAIFELMSQLGCEEELEDVPEDDVDEEFMDNDDIDTNDGEYRHYSQTEEIYAMYERKTFHSRLRLIASALITAIIFAFELMPMIGIEFSWIFSFRDYPGAYMLFGLQLLIICALFIGDPIWKGLKNILKLRPDMYSMVILIMTCNIVYDIAMVSLEPDKLCPMFHSLTAFALLGVQIAEYILLKREKKIFSIYSDDPARSKFTLRQSKGKNSVAEKMYAGGLSSKRAVYLPVGIDFPKGFFNAVNEERTGSRFVTFAMFPILIISIIFVIVAVLLGNDAVSSATAAMAIMFTVFPLNVIFSFCVPLYISASRLQKRGIALTGKKIMDRYAGVDVLVFEDIHLFRKCNTKDTGIVFLERSQATTVLGCMQILYSRIGGAMFDVFSDIPETCRAKNIRIRHIFKNGIEALVDKKNILIVGNHEFMLRYGMNFPKGEEKTGRGTLYISLNGKMSAKMSVKYTPEPIFEMLVERLAQAGVQTVVETFDPLVDASFVSSVRLIGESPISVVHKNTAQLYGKEKRVVSAEKDCGIIAISSRLKLAEAVIWCKRLLSLRKRNNMLTAVFSFLGISTVALLLAFGHLNFINQYWLLLFTVIPNTITFFMTLSGFPRKDHFSVKTCADELAERQAHVKDE